MSDDIHTGPQLVVPDPSKRIVSPAEAKRIEDHNRKYGAGGKRIRPPGDVMQDAMSRSEAMDHLGGAALAVGEKMYEQFTGETQEYLQLMEKDITERVLQAMRNEFDRRSLRGRLRALRLRFFPAKPRLLLPTNADLERSVADLAALDAMRPDGGIITGIAEPLEPLVWREFPKYDDEARVHVEAGGIALLTSRTGEVHALAKDADTIRRAHAQLGGENEIADDSTALLLSHDECVLAEARALCRT